MAEITVCIEFDDATGQYSVGMEPPEAPDAAMSPDGSAPPAPPPAGQAPGMQDLAKPPAPGDEEAGEAAYMKPARNLDDALAQARMLLRQAMPVGGAVMGGEPGGMGAQSAADAAFASRRGAKGGM